MKRKDLCAKALAAAVLTAGLCPAAGGGAAANAAEGEYVLMNIPYAEFYDAEADNEVPVDAFTSATLSKARSSLAAGSYHVNSDGSDITGITFPVKLGEGVDLSAYKQVTDEDTLTISVTMRGQLQETTYTGSETLFENETYAYYVLSEEPAFYKELTVNEDGSFSFGKVIGERQTADGVEAELVTESGYGDYGLYLNGLEDTIDMDAAVYAVVLETKEGAGYGLRHLENIWRLSSLAWCVGFTDDVHGCPTSSGHYEAMMGQTIDNVIYYTEQGIFEIPVELYVPVKFENTFAVEDAGINDGSTRVTLAGLPDDYAAEYSVEGLEGAAVADGVLSYAEAARGQYTLVVSDAGGKYAPLLADFVLSTDTLPAAFDASKGALAAAEGASQEEFAEYIASITSVNVDGTDYAAAGRGAVAVIGEDGSIALAETASAGAGSAELTVTALGYPELAFTYEKAAADGGAQEETPAAGLPDTGAAGTAGFAAIGALAVLAGAGVLCFGRRRTRA